MNDSVCACTPICQDDAEHIPQYLAEIERMGVRFVVLFDKCNYETRREMLLHKACVGMYVNDNKTFAESMRGGLYGIAKRLGFSVMMLWDIDETWERTAPDKLSSIVAYKEWDRARVAMWLNVWGDKNHIRTDRAAMSSNPCRVKFNRLDRGVEWEWRGIVVDPYSQPDISAHIKQINSGIVCLNHGLMTPELRRKHKDRWDRVYGEAVGTNPYKYWDCMLDEVNYPPTIEENRYG